MSDPRPMIIHYALPIAEIRYRPLLICAFALGGVPMVFGVSMLVLYAITSAQFFAIGGAFTLFVGTGMVAIGLVCLAIYFFANRLKDPLLRRRVNLQTRWAIALLLGNFPVAFVCLMIGSSILKFEP